MNKYDVAVIGGGPAGMAAATSARDAGAKRVLIIERDGELGGILNQCVHTGFGLHYFSQELSGPEYAQRFIELTQGAGIDVLTDTMALDVTGEREVRYINSTEGYNSVQANAVVLCMGCRERPRGALRIAGDRPSGVLTAGAAQRYVNIEGYMVGRRVVILGSGDIGLIMARRMTLEGAKVLACVEMLPYAGGLTRNVVQCLHDFDIPLYLSHTVTRIDGKGRLTGVAVSKVDGDRRPVPGSEMYFDCDTLLLSVGLIPENELSRGAGVDMDSLTNGAVVYENRETSIPGVFACGNVLHVHDLVDFVSEEAALAGRAAALFKPDGAYGDAISVLPGEGVRYTLPQKIRADAAQGGVELYFRADNVYTDAAVCVYADDTAVKRVKRARVVPGEMERVKIPAEVLESAGEIRVEVSKEA